MARLIGVSGKLRPLVNPTVSINLMRIFSPLLYNVCGLITDSSLTELPCFHVTRRWCNRALLDGQPGAAVAPHGSCRDQRFSRFPGSFVLPILSVPAMRGQEDSDWRFVASMGRMYQVSVGIT